MRILRKLLFVTVPSMLVAMAIGAVATELWLRATWDPRRGTPGLFLADPLLIERLAPGYDGWFAGVPIRINNLGFRDDRDYQLAKTPSTVRILILGDSVTFGHGSVYEHTYPYLLEQQLRSWRPDIDWQVWNTGVPGYTTSHELGYLLRAGPEFAPDIVIVGFYWNDVHANIRLADPGRGRRLLSTIKGATKGRLYSYDLYRKAYYTIRGQLSESFLSPDFFGVVAHQERLLEARDLTGLTEQQLTYPDEVPGPAPLVCEGQRLEPDYVAQTRASGTFAEWLAAVRELQALSHSARYRVIFFVNIAPDVCYAKDRFYDGVMRPLNDFIVGVLSDGRVPVVSAYDAFKRYRPSQMPLANGHALGNANWLKASTLFDFLRNYLPAELPLLREDVIAGTARSE